MNEISVREMTNMVKLARVICLKNFSWSEEIKYKLNHCLELALSFLKMHNITMFRFNITKIQSQIHLKTRYFLNVLLFHFEFVKFGKFVFEICVLET